MKPWCRQRGSMRYLLLIMVIPVVVILLVGLVSFTEAQGGGMMPLSEVIDHPVGGKDTESSSHASKNTEKPYEGKPLSQEKKDIHIKIAQSHLREEQGEGHHEEDSDGKQVKFARKDKSPDLQNPLKHASDEWLLKFMLEQYRKIQTVEGKVEILQNLENFSHKFENGRDLFKSTMAVKEILIPALNSTQPEIRKAACAVFAVAAQNNGVVQRIAKDAGAIRSLVHLLTFDPQVRTKALFALSTLLRNFPAAQAKFIHEGGIPALIKVAFSFETRKRSMSLVTDLLTERKYCLIDLRGRRAQRHQNEDDFSTTVTSDHVDHYENVEDPCDEFKVLEKALKDSGWCDVLADSVKSIGGFDVSDQILTTEAVASSISFCKPEIAPYSRIFQSLLVRLEDDDDFQEESMTLKSIIETITSPDRDEL